MKRGRYVYSVIAESSLFFNPVAGLHCDGLAFGIWPDAVGSGGFAG